MQTKTVGKRTWHFSHVIGTIAVRGRGFYHPTAVAIAPGGILYVLSPGTKPIKKLSIDEEFFG